MVKKIRQYYDNIINGSESQTEHPRKIFMQSIKKHSPPSGLSIALALVLLIVPAHLSAEAKGAAKAEKAEATGETPPTVDGETRCRTEITYLVKKGEVERKEFFAVVERVGASEDETKRILDEYVLREKGRAQERCREQHENLSGCIASRFASHGTVFSNLTFTARRALETAINEDCTALQGICGAAQATELVCAREIKAAAEASPAADTEKEKADTKKKK